MSVFTVLLSVRASSALSRSVLVLSMAVLLSPMAWGQAPKKPSLPSVPAKPAAKPTAPAKPAGQPPKPSASAKPAAPAQHAPASKNSSAISRPAPVQNGNKGQPSTTSRSSGSGRPTTGNPASPLHPASAKESLPLKSSSGKSLSLKTGGKAQVRSNGQIRSVDKNGMHIEHNLHGGRKVVSDRNGKHIVSNGKKGGYVQRPLTTRNGHSYYARTSVDHGVAHSGVYRGYSYGGHTYYAYQPAAYYSPGFYGWAGGAWASPVAWDSSAWGWGGAPWLGYYGFSPYGFYPGPAFWLTDYLIAANLQAAYAGLGGDGINVIANQPWTDTGTPVVQGQAYVITASGIVNYSGADTSAVATPDGRDWPGCERGAFHNGFAAPHSSSLHILDGQNRARWSRFFCRRANDIGRTGQRRTLPRGERQQLSR